MNEIIIIETAITVIVFAVSIGMYISFRISEKKTNAQLVIAKHKLDNILLERQLLNTIEPFRKGLEKLEDERIRLQKAIDRITGTDSYDADRVQKHNDGDDS